MFKTVTALLVALSVIGAASSAFAQRASDRSYGDPRNEEIRLDHAKGDVSGH